jgi:hypothetical protein
VKRRRDASATRFVVAGLLKTAVTYAAVLAPGLVVAAWIARTIAFVVGLVWVALGSSALVFGVWISAKPILQSGA